MLDVVGRLLLVSCHERYAAGQKRIENNAAAPDVGREVMRSLTEDLRRDKGKGADELSDVLSWEEDSRETEIYDLDLAAMISSLHDIVQLQVPVDHT